MRTASLTMERHRARLTDADVKISISASFSSADSSIMADPLRAAEQAGRCAPRDRLFDRADADRLGLVARAVCTLPSAASRSAGRIFAPQRSAAAMPPMPGMLTSIKMGRAHGLRLDQRLFAVPASSTIPSAAAEECTGGAIRRETRLSSTIKTVFAGVMKFPGGRFAVCLALFRTIGGPLATFETLSSALCQSATTARAMLSERNF